jgi:hypothetical protein
MTRRRASLLTAIVLAAAVLIAPAARADGTRNFVARPTLGAAILQLPSTVSWRTTPNPNGTYRVALTAETDIRSVLANIKILSARALDRSIPCGDAVKILGAAAKLTGATTLKYDLRFHYVKRVCAGTYPVEWPADVTCSSRLSLSAARSVITIDVQGAVAPPCRIEGVYQRVSGAVYAIVGIDVFKRHAVDLSKQLPPEFKGVTIDIRSLAFDLPPAPAKLRVTGESTMSPVQYKEFVARIDAATPKTK